MTSLVVIGMPIVFFVFTKDTLDWNGLMSGVFSTGLALIVGIPIALWIDRIIKSQEQKEKERADREKEKEILYLIEEEIRWNSEKISSERKIEGFDPLKTEYWEVLKSSGNLNYIPDPKLLNRITSAYHVIKVVESLENEANFDWNFRNKVLDVDSKWKTLWEKSKHFHPLLLDSVDEAIKMIKIRKNVI